MIDNKMMKQELHVVVMPDGSLQPEWSETSSYITQSSERMQAEIFRHFSDSPVSWLLFIGFCDPHIALPPSLSFFRRFSGRFIRKLARTPDLETLRDKVAIDIRPETLADSLDSVPMMTGADYINRDLLQEILTGLL